MKIIIYGIGNGIVNVERTLKENYQIVGYSDSFFDGNEFKGKKYIRLNDLHSIEFDFIVIAISKLNDSINVYEKLIRMGINKKKVINYYIMYYALERRKIKQINNDATFVDERMLSNEESVDGIVLGISYGERGINKDLLSGNVLNLAYGSQDLYYNYCVLNYISNIDVFSNLKYAIIDMWNYNYFNYDLSKTQNVIRYYLSSGFGNNDMHNYKLNKYYDDSIKEKIIDIRLDDEDIKIFYNLFNYDLLDLNNKEGIYQKHITDEEINEYISKKNKHRSSIELKHFDDTINENIDIFKKILDKLVEINSDIKIYIVLLPEYIIVENEEINTFNNWKIEFYEILNKYEKKYNLKILDFKKLKDISSEKNNYYDLYHLNMEGARKFTNILNKYIEV